MKKQYNQKRTDLKYIQEKIRKEIKTNLIQKTKQIEI